MNELIWLTKILLNENKIKKQTIFLTFGVCVSDVLETGWVKVKYEVEEGSVDDAGIEAKWGEGISRRPEWSSGIRQQLPMEKISHCL